ncbi:LLM class flavin-dependent oxidoreductase [Sporosarcina soli]|uniref:LLM class flavin-dependent oxidoreductase n=1 Tax=Sporosarcina soli TaxID=334736 RepID=A0ABW0TMG2_9BACL
MTNKKMRLGAFVLTTGHHLASWRYPTAGTERIFDLDYYAEIAQLAERAKFDMFFLADAHMRPLSKDSYPGYQIDPVTLISALAAVTTNIGLTATLTSTYNEPFHIARKFNAIDHLSKGRAAWNVVTSFNSEEALLYGFEQHVDHSKRYARAEESIEVVKRFWSSIEEEAILNDKERGKYLDPKKIHPVNHKGEFFKAQGTLESPTTPQGHPVIVQAGNSEAGRELAAKTADVVFTAWQTLEEAQSFYRDVKGRLAKYGRQPDDLKVMPGAFIIVGKTEEEAKRKREELNSYITPQDGLAYLSLYNVLDFDLTGYDINDPLPEGVGQNKDSTNPNMRPALVKAIAERNNLTTLREIYEHVGGARGHREIVGTPEQVVDQLEEWFLNDGADGFNIMAPHFPEGFKDIVELVIPELQRRGLFRTEYEASTLRGNLGVPIPTNPLVQFT